MTGSPSIAAALAVVSALAVGASYVAAARSLSQRGDGYSGLVWAEAAALANGTTLTALNDHGETVTTEGRCGMFGVRQFSRHYAPGATYIIAAASWLGADPMRVPAAFIGLSLALLVYQLGSVSVAVLLGLAPWVAPGIGSWVAYPIEMGWDLAACCLLAAAALCRRPVWPLFGAALVAPWLSGLAPIQAAVVVGFVLAAHGAHFYALLAALAAFAGYCLGFVAKLAQLWCFFGWQWFAVVADFFTGATGGTSLAYRMTAMSLTDRLASAFIWLPAYGREIVTSTQWTTPAFWWLIVAVAACIRPTRWALVGASAVMGGALLYHVVLPATLPPQMHILPRVGVVLLVLAVCCLTVRGRA